MMCLGNYDRRAGGQYVDKRRVGGCTCMLTCGDASVADGDAENKDKARDLVDLESSNNAKVREGVAPPRFCFFFLPALRAGRGAALRPPPFPVRPPRGSRTPRGNGGPQSGFVGQNLVFWIIAFLCLRRHFW